MAFIVWLDVDGNEVKREVKTRGRPPKGTVRKDGNFYVTKLPGEDSQIYYIEMDKDGFVIKRETKGRGRPRPGFKKNTDDGNWYKFR